MTKHNRFTRRGSSSTFKCITCLRTTRDTGQGVDHLCMECFEIAGLDNQVNDSGEPCPADVLAECERHLAKIAKLGGNVENVKAANGYIWPDKPAPKPKKAKVSAAGAEFEVNRSEALKLIEELQARVTKWGRGRDIDFADVSDITDTVKALREAKHWSHEQ